MNLTKVSMLYNTVALNHHLASRIFPLTF
jgi:hypothetical protein